MYRNGIKRLLAVILSLCGMIVLSPLLLIVFLMRLAYPIGGTTACLSRADRSAVSAYNLVGECSYMFLLANVIIENVAEKPSSHRIARLTATKSFIFSDAWSLLGGFHAGHLRACDHRRAAESSPDDGEHPISCRLMLSATRSRWGQRLGQKKAVPKKRNL